MESILTGGVALLEREGLNARQLIDSNPLFAKHKVINTSHDMNTQWNVILIMCLYMRVIVNHIFNAANNPS